MPLSAPSDPDLIDQAQVLSTPELFRAVQELAPAVAVFDCDGTLWSGDAGSTFMWWTIETGLLGPEKAATMQRSYEAYLRGEIPEVDICSEMAQVYAGIPIERLRAAAATFFREHVAGNIFPELHELIAKLQESGTEIWAVSSSINWIIEEGVRRFNIPADHVLCARVAEQDGLATDRLLDVPTDEGKVLALRHAGVTAPDAAFGNSVHDAAMLAFAHRAFPISPTPALVERSTREGWPVYWPASVLPSL